VGQGSNDGVLEIWDAGRDHLDIRIGLQFHDPERRQALLLARYVRVQVTSPPPLRVDGTTWLAGLALESGAPFDPSKPPTDGQVFPVSGTAPLAQPDPRTIVLDQWFEVPKSPEGPRLPTFTLGPTGPPGGPLSFKSVPYPDPRKDGEVLSEVEVDYCAETQPVGFDRDVNIAVDGAWVAVSLDRFFPPERASADSIVRVISDA
jgi:hypothetical protein